MSRDIDIDHRTLPSKSKATISSPSVGVTDIQTPSVVRIADPAKEVSTRWFKVKLLPTDCSPEKLEGHSLPGNETRTLHTHRRNNTNRLIKVSISYLMTHTQ